MQPAKPAARVASIHALTAIVVVIAAPYAARGAGVKLRRRVAGARGPFSGPVFSRSCQLAMRPSGGTS
jgi:hypothetical protein